MNLSSSSIHFFVYGTSLVSTDFYLAYNCCHYSLVKSGKPSYCNTPDVESSNLCVL